MTTRDIYLIMDNGSLPGGGGGGGGGGGSKRKYFQKRRIQIVNYENIQSIMQKVSLPGGGSNVNQIPLSKFEKVSKIIVFSIEFNL